jgi:hypothetical protein
MEGGTLPDWMASTIAGSTPASIATPMAAVMVVVKLWQAESRRDGGTFPGMLDEVRYL